MSVVLTNATIVLDDLDLSGETNEVSLEMSRADHDVTNFRSGGKEHKAGMMDASGTVSGFWNEAADQKLEDLADTAGLFVFSPTSTIGSPTYAFEGVVLSHSVGGAVDEILPWSMNFASAGREGVKAGAVLADPSATYSVAGGLTGFQLGAVPTGGSLTVGVHTFDVAGGVPDLDIQLQSSTSNAWGTPTTRATFTNLVAGDVEYNVVAGPVTHTWWRVNITTISGAARFLVVAWINS